LQQDFDVWRKQGLSQLKAVYLFRDVIYLALRQGTKEKEGVGRAYGIREDGKQVLLYFEFGSREPHDFWLSFLTDATAKRLGEPLPLVSDEPKGLTQAGRQVFFPPLQATLSGAQDKKYSLPSPQEDAEADQGIGAGGILRLKI